MATPNGALLIPELLQEIFRVVLDAHGDFTLETCMLVCQTWLSLCYPIRFRRFEFKGFIRDEDEEPPPDWYRGNSASEDVVLHDRTFADFLEFLTGSTRLCPHIKELKLESRFRTLRWSCGNDRREPKIVGLEVDLLWKIITLLPELRVLDLSVYSLDFPDTPSSSQPSAGLQLEKLTLRNARHYPCFVPSNAHLAYFLQSFQTIRHLVLESVTPKFRGSSHNLLPFGGRSEKLQVERLTLTDDNSNALRTSLDPTHLSILDICAIDALQLGSLLPLNILRPNLQEVHLGSLSYEHDEAPYLDLRKCSDLATLQLHFLLVVDPVGWLPYNLPETGFEGWDCACRMVSEVPPSALRELKLAFQLLSIPSSTTSPTLEQLLIAQLKRIDWPRLESAVRQHPQLESVRIQIAPRLDEHQLADASTINDLVLKTLVGYVLPQYSCHQRLRTLVRFDIAPPVHLSERIQNKRWFRRTPVLPR